MRRFSHAPPHNFILDETRGAKSVEMHAHRITARADTFGQFDRGLWMSTQFAQQPAAGVTEHSFD